MRSSMVCMTGLLVLASLAAATRPTTVPALRTWPTLPAEQNAAEPLLRAIRVLTSPDRARQQPRPETNRNWQTMIPPLSDDDVRDLRALREFWADVLSIIDEIDARPDGFDWGEPPPSPVIDPNDEFDRSAGNVRADGLNAGRDLLAADGLLAAEAGDASVAWRRADQLARIADATRRWPQSMFVARTKAFDESASRLYAVAAASRGFPAFALANRQHVAEVAKRLNDDAIVRLWHSDYLELERAILVDAVDAFEHGWKPAKPTRLNTSAMAGLLTYSGKLPKGRAAADTTIDLAATLVDATKPFAVSSESPHDRIQAAVFAGGMPLIAVASDALPRLANTRHSLYEQLAARRLAAATIAIALYRIDHAGDLPPTLVAAGVDAPWIDPLAREAIDIHYDRDRAIVWSVGTDGTDHGGISHTAGMTFNERQRTDLVVRLGVP